MYYDTLLKMNGFQPEEIKQERYRIEKAFDRAEIGPDDCARAEETVRTQHGMDLVGTRKMRRIWLKDFIDMVLAGDEGKRIVFNATPNVPRLGSVVALALPPEKFCVCSPDVVTGEVMAGIFGKINPILEAAEASVLKPGLANCSMELVRLGVILKGLIPPPSLIISADDWCDTGPKADEIIGEMWGSYIIHTDCPIEDFGQDWAVVSPRRSRFLAAEFERGMAKIEELTGVHISDQTVREAHAWFNHIYGAQHYAHLLARQAEPKAVRDADLTQFIQIFTGITRRTMTDAAEALDIFIGEIQDRVNKGIGLPEVPGGRRRVWVLLTSVHDIRWFTLLESEEIGLEVGSSMSFRTAKELRPSPWESHWERAAEIELRLGGRYGGTGFIRALAESCRELNLDGCIMNAMYTCNAGRSLIFASKDYLEKELDVPTLILEWDYMDKRDYSNESVRSRVETFAEILRARPKRRKPTLDEILKHYDAMGVGDRTYQPGMLKEAV
jgi:benzoyl-CoA reductase/2-hydroxyglutaryl-CoA dehydratase subunit BcrC/BadD/HgdB